MSADPNEAIPDLRSQGLGAAIGAAIGVVFTAIKSGVPATADQIGSFALVVMAFAFAGAVLLCLPKAFRDYRI